MRNILIISNNPLSETQHNAKTILSLLGNHEEFSLRQLFFRDGVPTYLDCDYYKITDRQMLNSIPFWRQSAGCHIDVPCVNDNTDEHHGPHHVSPSSYLKRLLREIIWIIGRVDRRKLNNWLAQSRNDLIFFVGGDSVFAYKLVCEIADQQKCPLVLFITDDYLLKRTKASVFFEIRRRWLLRNVVKMLPKVGLFITISQEMCTAYEALLNKKSMFYANMPQDYDVVPHITGAKNIKKEIVLTYAGGLHYNRWKTLSALGNALQKYNAKNGTAIRLEIYSQECPPGEILNGISIPNASFYMGAASAENIKTILNTSDVLVHVESFEQKDIEATRLSFSTKIYEYMASTKAILAIGPDSIASMRYLRDCSFCVNSPDDITAEIFDRIVIPEERNIIAMKSTAKFIALTQGKNNKRQLINAIMKVGK